MKHSHLPRLILLGGALCLNPLSAQSCLPFLFKSKGAARKAPTTGERAPAEEAISKEEARRILEDLSEFFGYGPLPASPSPQLGQSSESAQAGSDGGSDDEESDDELRELRLERFRRATRSTSGSRQDPES